MVDETQNAWVAAEVVLRDPAPINVSGLYAETIHQTDEFFPLQISNVYAEAIHRTHDVFETQIGSVHLEVMRSLDDLILPALVVRPSTLELWPVDKVESARPPVPGPAVRATSIEQNPYRPDVPIHLSEDDPDLYEYLREQAELLRQQHNLTQAGDSTFPWEIATLPSDKAEFTLGSMSRFVHATMGLISGRFVQYAADTVQPTLILGLDRGGTEWVGTQKPKRTSVWRPLGINLAAGELGGKYGWVMTHGRSPVSITVESELPTLPENQALTWDPATPDLLLVGAGPEIARIIDPTPAIVTVPSKPGRHAWVLPAGTWVVGLNGGVTSEYIDSRFAGLLPPIRAEIDALEAAIQALEAQDFGAAITALSKQQDLFDRRLKLEQQQRNQTDANLNRKIETLNEAVGRLTNSQGGTDLTGVYQELDALKGVVARTNTAQDDRLAALEQWRVQASDQIKSLLAAVELNQKPQFWCLTAEGTGDPQAILLPSNGLAADQVLVHVNGLKWGSDEFTIVEQELTITTNAAGDLIEIIGF